MSEATEKTGPEKAEKAEKGKTEAKAEKAETKPSKRFTRKSLSAEEVARKYFQAFEKPDLDAIISAWAPGGVDRIVAIGELRAPDEIRAFFSELFAAFPDVSFAVLDLVAQGDKVAVRWRSSGTFCGGPFQGIEPTGARVEMEGVDVLTIEDGLIRRNDAYYDGTDFARQIGLLPPRQSGAERGMAAAFNARTRVARALFGPKREQVAEGVWLLRGGFPAKTMNVYLIEEEDGVTVFDAGIEAMTKGIASVAVPMGGINRVLLGHSHADHRGAAPGLGSPVWCHVDEVADAEGDGGEHYLDYSALERGFARFMMPRLIRRWDGGRVKIDETVKEGDEIAGFTVVHLPGHAPGLIGLWRESDRLALVSDALYTLDPQTGKHGPPRVPHRAFNKDTEQARQSILKLAAMEPAAVWPGHAAPVIGDVREQHARVAQQG